MTAPPGAVLDAALIDVAHEQADAHLTDPLSSALVELADADTAVREQARVPHDGLCRDGDGWCVHCEWVAGLRRAYALFDLRALLGRDLLNDFALCLAALPGAA